ncbi:MAG: shikimate kinase, partial [Promethearchaeota archaeon]
YETQLCKDFYLYENYVISCGGGVILNPENVKILQKVANVILLTASADTIIQRTLKTRNSTRPLLNTKDPHKTIQEMLRQRNPLYEEASHIKISTDNKSIDNIVNEILKKIKEKNDHE